MGKVIIGPFLAPVVFIHYAIKELLSDFITFLFILRSPPGIPSHLKTISLVVGYHFLHPFFIVNVMNVFSYAEQMQKNLHACAKKLEMHSFTKTIPNRLKLREHLINMDAIMHAFAK